MTHHHLTIPSTRTLHRFTTQQVFDFVVNSVIAQNAPSINIDGGCAYRGPGGIKCAIGFLIEDQDYHYLLRSDFGANIGEVGEVGQIQGWSLGLINQLGWKRFDSEQPEFRTEAAYYQMLGRLQTAHDRAALNERQEHLGNEAFIRAFKAAVVGIAEEFGISARAAITAADTSDTDVENQNA